MLVIEKKNLSLDNKENKRNFIVNGSKKCDQSNESRQMAVASTSHYFKLLKTGREKT